MAPTTRKLMAMGGVQIKQGDPLQSPKEVLPTMYDLPSEDPEEPGLPDEFHDLQPQLLSRTLSLTGYKREDCFTGSDLNLYYDVRHPLWHKRPDWFLVVDVPRLYEQRDLRRSYVLWQEGTAPYVVVEFLSPGTEAEDLGRFYDEDEGLESQPIVSANSTLADAEREGNWLLTDTEQAQQQVEQAQTQLLQAAQNLLAMGMALEQVTQILNLSKTQSEALRSLDSKWSN